MLMEAFRPVSNTRGNSLLGKLKFYGRMILDLQIFTIYQDLTKTLPKFSGKVLDVGCGQSPYLHLLNQEKCKYYGIDIEEANAQFKYDNKSVTFFDGKNIPFENDFFDGIICTEVLEHVYEHQYLVDEMFRVLKKGGEGIITIPWSARFHYIPHDYFRYTPSALKNIFSKFTNVEIKNRGNDITVITNKLLVMWVRNIVTTNVLKWLFIPIWIIALPILASFFVVAHFSIMLDFGSKIDPLGYTINVKK
jgi:ubiquinone/menaquinone biosynthesis C-methylase UbiE